MLEDQDEWKDIAFKCKNCGWQGSDDEVYWKREHKDGTGYHHCPACHSIKLKYREVWELTDEDIAAIERLRSWLDKAPEII